MVPSVGSKVKIIQQYMEEADEVLSERNNQKMETYIKKIVGIYSEEIPSIRQSLRFYTVGDKASLPTDIEFLKSKLLNYKINLESGLYMVFSGKTEGAVNITQTTSQTQNTNVSINFEQTIETINNLPEDVLSDEEKELLNGKLASLSTCKTKESCWEKAKGILKWIADKGVQVGTAALPYIMKMIETV